MIKINKNTIQNLARSTLKVCAKRQGKILSQHLFKTVSRSGTLNIIG